LTVQSEFIASTTSRVWNAVASRTARAMCPRSTKRVSPTSAPRASGRQYGANSPENAGTKYAPPLSSTVRASASTSAASEIRPRLVAERVADRRQQTVVAEHLLGTGVEQQEIAGSISVFGFAGC
jgi:hypothetical protein